VACGRCGKKRKFYCYTCYASLLPDGQMPVVALPFAIDVYVANGQWHDRR
jgi:hypothetical protein